MKVGKHVLTKVELIRGTLEDGRCIISRHSSTKVQVSVDSLWCCCWLHIELLAPQTLRQWISFKILTQMSHKSATIQLRHSCECVECLELSSDCKCGMFVSCSSSEVIHQVSNCGGGCDCQLCCTFFTKEMEWRGEPRRKGGEVSCEVRRWEN